MGKKTTPPAADPRPGRNRGYPEPQPRDKEEAAQPSPGKPRDPDEGGIEREPNPRP